MKLLELTSSSEELLAMTLELDSTLLLDFALLEDEDLPSSLPSPLLDSGSEPGMTLEELAPSTSLRATLEEELDSIDDEEFTELEDFAELLDPSTSPPSEDMSLRVTLEEEQNSAARQSFLLLEERDSGSEPGMTDDDEPGMTDDDEPGMTDDDEPGMTQEDEMSSEITDDEDSLSASSLFAEETLSSQATIPKAMATTLIP